MKTTDATPIQPEQRPGADLIAGSFARPATSLSCGERKCPLRADATRAARLGRDLATALHRLKRRIRGCIRNGCQSETCPYFIQVSQQLQSAIAQVLEECVPEYMGQAPASPAPENTVDAEDHP